MIVELVALVIFWINALPPSPSVGGNISLRHIVTGVTADYTKHCRLQFGKYAQVPESHDNTMQEWSMGDIAQRPTRNSQGEYFSMSLATGWRLNRQSFTLLPLPQDVINSVHLIACHNTRGINIQDRDWRPSLEAEYGANNDIDNDIYSSSNK